MRILITGGTGFIGRRLAARLVEDGHDVTVFARGEDAPKGVKLIRGDVLNADDAKAAMNPLPDVIYHLAAILDETNPDMEKVIVEGTKNFLAKGVKRFILLSSVGVLGEAKTPLTEDMPYRPGTKYEKAKVMQEKLVIGSGVPYTIMRSTIVYGPNRFWKDILNAAKKGHPIIGSGKNFWHLVYVDDVVEVLILALKDEAENHIFNIADSDPMTYREIYAEICRALGVSMPKKSVPVFAAKLFARWKELTGKSKTTTRVSSITRLVRNRIVDISKARKVLGYEPRYSFKKGLKVMINSLEMGIKT
ncbi:MAG: NAD(P)-dependent oxidoreductase [Candidatus Micrarchaeota archaeon]|nr:NAD(P)-dependent oxidoreductase [Candidatus Micrarchaeota archaeon]